ncbi:MAG: hypothetical protein GF365_03560 [Candidatus Buchananbacteria bacterium]|nr:hypothetical protein [Candidatus Buchananbacteria bacterium]
MRIFLNLIISILSFIIITLAVTGLLQPYIFFSYFIGIPVGLVSGFIIFLILNSKYGKK